MGPQSDEVINVVVNSFGVLFENLFGITLPWSKAAAQKKCGLNHPPTPVVSSSVEWSADGAITRLG